MGEGLDQAHLQGCPPADWQVALRCLVALPLNYKRSTGLADPEYVVYRYKSDIMISQRLRSTLATMWECVKTSCTNHAAEFQMQTPNILFP